MQNQQNQSTQNQSTKNQSTQNQSTQIQNKLSNGNFRTEELNNRLSQRNIPSANLQPQFGIRAISTKYAMLPILDRRAHPTEPINNVPTYDPYATFNPGSATAPWSGFAANINNESKLRNQFYALQRGCGQSTFIPATTSDMYQVNIPQPVQNTVEESFPYLFEKSSFENFNPCFTGGGANLFDNCTRYQLKETS